MGDTPGYGGIFGATGVYAYADGDVPVWDETLRRFKKAAGGGGGITELTGDVLAGPGSGSQVATLDTTGVTPGTYGDATNVAQITVDDKGRITAAADVPIAAAGATRAIGGSFDGGGSELVVGSTFVFFVPYACDITACTLVGLDGESGDIELDIKTSSYAGYSGSLASIVASAPPTISGSNKSQDNTLTGWTTSVSAGTAVEISITSVTDLTFVHVSLTVTV